MQSSQFLLPLADELIVDLFAGGGGASTGIEQAVGRHVDVAVNHDPDAVGLHFPSECHTAADYELAQFGGWAAQPTRNA